MRRSAGLFALTLLLPLAAQDRLPAPGQLGVERLPEEVQQELGLPAGAAVGVVSRHSPAEIAGIKPGDVIVAEDGAAVAGFPDLAQAIQRHPPGADIAVEFLRGGERKSVRTKLARKAEDQRIVDEKRRVVPARAHRRDFYGGELGERLGDPPRGLGFVERALRRPDRGVGHASTDAGGARSRSGGR